MNIYAYSGEYRKEVKMKTFLRLLPLVLLICVTAEAGEFKKDPFAVDPTWEYRDDKGHVITIRQDPFAVDPTFEWSDDEGNSGTIEQDPFAVDPTWEYEEDGKTVEEEPFDPDSSWED